MTQPIVPPGLRAAEPLETYAPGDLLYVDTGGILPGSRFWAIVSVVGGETGGWSYFSSWSGRLENNQSPDRMLAAGLFICRPIRKIGP